MSSCDPFTDDSAHVSVGHVQMRIGYLAHCLGIPAATLSALRDGSMVAVPKHALIIVMNRINARYSSYEPDALDHAAGAINKMLAAAKDARHD